MTRRTLATAALCLAAALVGLVSAPDVDACRTVDVTEHDDTRVMLAAGWTGDPSDGAERLYSPECAR